MSADERKTKVPSENVSDRRKFLATASTAATSVGLAGGYGAFGLITQLADGTEDAVREETASLHRPGHDPCLARGEDRFARKA